MFLAMFSDVSWMLITPDRNVAIALSAEVTLMGPDETGWVRRLGLSETLDTDIVINSRQQHRELERYRKHRPPHSGGGETGR